MALKHPLIDVDTVRPAAAEANTGALDLRLLADMPQVRSALAYRLTVPPGSARGRQTNRNTDEALICLSGSGRAGVGEAVAEMRAGHCQLIPRSREHFFVNTGDDDAIFIGFYLGVADAEAIGLERGAPVDPASPPAITGGLDDGILVHLDDVAPENMNKGDGWHITDFRLPLSARNGCTSTLFRARFLPGSVHAKHRHENCEEIYYVISGHGLAGAGPDRVEVRGGQFHFIPSGVEHFMHNLSDSEPIEAVGVYVNAGSVKDTGYVFMGSVTEDDLATRT